MKVTISAAGIERNINLCEIHCQTVETQQLSGEERACPGEILYGFGCLQRADDTCHNSEWPPCLILLRVGIKQA